MIWLGLYSQCINYTADTQRDAQITIIDQENQHEIKL